MKFWARRVVPFLFKWRPLRFKWLVIEMLEWSTKPQFFCLQHSLRTLFTSGTLHARASSSDLLMRPDIDIIADILTIWLLTGMLRVVWLANLTNKVGRTYTLDTIVHNRKKYGTEYCPLRYTSVDCHVVGKKFIPHNPLFSFTLKFINQMVTCGPEPTLYSLLQIK